MIVFLVSSNRFTNEESIQKSLLKYDTSCVLIAFLLVVTAFLDYHRRDGRASEVSTRPPLSFTSTDGQMKQRGQGQVHRYFGMYSERPSTRPRSTSHIRHPDGGIAVFT